MMQGILDYFQTADPESETPVWRDIPIGLRLGVLGNQLMAMSQGRDPGMQGLALMAAASRDSVENRKAEKQRQKVMRYAAKHPDPRIREAMQMGLIDPADILKQELDFDRFKQEKTFETELAQKQRDAMWAPFMGGGGGGSAPVAGGAPAASSGAPAPAPAAGGVPAMPQPGQSPTSFFQSLSPEELQIAMAQRAAGKGPDEVMAAIIELRQKRETEQRMAQGESRQQAADIDRRGTDIATAFTKRVEPLAVVQQAADAAERIKIDPQTGLPDATGAQTIETLYGFVKALDPDSVVREAEVSLAGEAAALMDRFKFWQQKIFNGEAGALPPEALADIKNAINMMANAARAKEMRARMDAFRQGGGRGVGNIDAFLPSIGGRVAPGNTAAIRTPFNKLEEAGIGGARYEANAPITAVSTDDLLGGL